MNLSRLEKEGNEMQCTYILLPLYPPPLSVTSSSVPPNIKQKMSGPARSVLRNALASAC